MSEGDVVLAALREAGGADDLSAVGHGSHAAREFDRDGQVRGVDVKTDGRVLHIERYAIVGEEVGQVVADFDRVNFRIDFRVDFALHTLCLDLSAALQFDEEAHFDYVAVVHVLLAGRGDSEVAAHGDVVGEADVMVALFVGFDGKTEAVGAFTEIQVVEVDLSEYDRFRAHA